MSDQASLNREHILSILDQRCLKMDPYYEAAIRHNLSESQRIDLVKRVNDFAYAMDYPSFCVQKFAKVLDDQFGIDRLSAKDLIAGLWESHRRSGPVADLCKAYAEANPCCELDEIK